MKIADIKAGKKYYHTLATNVLDKRARKKFRTVNTFFVVEVDKTKNRVCASLNGAPAQWYDCNKYARWTEDKPELENI